jgi:hypothetical protein
MDYERIHNRLPEKFKRYGHMTTMIPDYDLVNGFIRLMSSSS